MGRDDLGDASREGGDTGTIQGLADQFSPRVHLDETRGRPNLDDEHAHAVAVRVRIGPPYLKRGLATIG